VSAPASGAPALAQEIRPGIWWLKGLKGSGGCKSYLLQGTRKTVLIDSGLPADAEALERGLASLGLARSDVHLVLLTHEHMDHIGGVPFFPPSTVVAAHRQAANKISLQDEFVLWNRAFGIPPERFAVDLHLEQGTLIDLGGLALRTVHTPGHVSGAVCFHELSNHVLFTGDTVFANGILGGIYPSGSISDYVGSLRRLSELRLELLCSGHGGDSTDPYLVLETAIRRSEGLIDETRALFDSVQSAQAFGHIRQAVVSYAKRDAA
jgi:glyoxylase-like metal-dependent hydrolase (beta-lactamase superfamily II)